MPRNGSGGYSPPAGQPVVSGTAISSTVFNALVADLGNELTKSICTDGQTPMTANLPMGANRVTNLGAAVAAGDAVRLDQITGYLPLAGGTVTGNVTFNNNVGLLAKDSGGTAYGLLYVGSDNQVYLTNTGAQNVVFQTRAGAAMATLTNAGVFSPTSNIQFNNNTGLFARDAGGTPRAQLVCASDNNTYFTNVGGQNIYFQSAAGVVIATLNNSGAFSANTVTQTSDERKKKLWQRLPHDFVKQLATLRKSGLFTWRKGGALGIGVGAQSFERIFPAAVHTDEKGQKSINYGAAALVSCVELAREVEALKAELAKLVNK